MTIYFHTCSVSSFASILSFNTVTSELKKASLNNSGISQSCSCPVVYFVTFSVALQYSSVFSGHNFVNMLIASAAYTSSLNNRLVDLIT
jgi:hypothetical protein